MVNPLRTLALFVLAVLLACGPAPSRAPIQGPINGAGASAPPVTAAFWLPGEVATFDVLFRGVVVAQMVVAVGKPGVIGGREVIIVRSRARTTGLLASVRSVSEDATSWIDRSNASTRERRMVERHGERLRRYHLVFGDGQTSVARWQGSGASDPSRWVMTTPAGEPMFDNQAILGVLRSWWPEKRGAVAAIHAITDRLLNRHVLRYSGREVLQWGHGGGVARRFDVELWTMSGHQQRDQGYSIWFADDETRAPVRMEVPHQLGRIVLRLRRHERPATDAATVR